MSSDTQPSDYVPLPEYEVEQYFPKHLGFDEEHRRRLREEYGFIRAYFKLRPGGHRNLQRWLNQGRFGTTYDIYLERAARFAIGATILGVVLGVLVSTALSNAGVLATLTSPLKVSGSLVGAIAAYKVPIAMGLLTLLSALLFGGGTFALFYYYPWYVADNRRRNMDVMLPHAIVFMYALSHGGMNLLQVAERLAAADDAYGEVSKEFDMIVRDVELFGNDLMTAFRNARNLTPSQRLEQFFDDLVGVIEAGGDQAAFLEDEAERYLDEAYDSQADFLETLALLSEVFIVLFVAAPLFAIVILIVISLLGGESVAMLQLFIYAILPLSMGGFVVLVSVLSNPYVMPSVSLTSDYDLAEQLDASGLADDPRFQTYKPASEHSLVETLRDDPIGMLRTQPLYSLVVSVPVAVLVVVSAFATGIVPTSIAALTEEPFQATMWLVVYPLLITSIPLAVFHELRRGREAVVTRRVPVMLNILSSANNMGIPMTDALEMLANWMSGVFAEELRYLRNDVEWNNDLSAALIGFGNRMRVPQLSRTLKLLAEGSRSTGDLAKILQVAAVDTRNRYRMAKKRTEAMSSYIAVVIIAFLVYLMVVALLEAAYLAPIAEIPTGSVEDLPPGAGGVPVTLGELPVDQYRLMFFHSAIIQGFGTGLLAGKLVDNRLLSGLKYSIGLVLLSILTFALL